jgi:hypothetical protein
MKHNFVRTISFVTLAFVLTASAPAQEWLRNDASHRRQPPTCTVAGRAGEYGYTWTGTMFFPTGAVPDTAVGRNTFDEEGNFEATQTVSRGGTISQLTVKGTYTVNPDCTGTITASVYDQSGNLTSNVTWATVSVNNMTEAYATMTSMVTANGTNVPVAITSNATKLFPGHKWEGHADR